MRIMVVGIATLAVMGCAFRGPQAHGPDAAVAAVEHSDFVRDLKSKHPATDFVVWSDGHLADGELVYIGEIVRDDADSCHSVRWATVLVDPDSTMRRYDVVTCVRGEHIR